ncbi:hypothetical protein ACOSQ2_008275 [Xanthoceras sorbifolium]
MAWKTLIPVLIRINRVVRRKTTSRRCRSRWDPSPSDSAYQNNNSDSGSWTSKQKSRWEIEPLSPEMKMKDGDKMAVGEGASISIFGSLCLPFFLFFVLFLLDKLSVIFFKIIIII